jgi:poly(A) polymerase
MQPQIIPRTHHAISRNLISPEALKVLYRIKENGYLAFLCGGCVRDILLEREPKDFDLATNARPEELKRIFRNCRLVGRRFRLAHILFGNDFIEVATFRALSDGKEPEVSAPSHRLKADSARTADGIIVRDNVFGSPEEDALRRDFTVNALFYNIADFSLIDYVNGISDIQARLLRCIGDPRKRYVEDPVRMLRAIRFSASLDLRMEDETFAAIADCRDYLALASPARLFEEVLKLFSCSSTATVYRYLKETGMLGVLFPTLAEWIASNPGGDVLTAAGFAYLDACKRDGRSLNTATQFAIVFGGLHEGLAGLPAAGPDGRVDVSAAMEAVDRHFDALRSRVTVPRSVSMDVAHIMALQGRFADRRPANVSRLIRRPSFEDALEYYAFKAHFNQTGHEDVIWWSTTDIPEPHPVNPHPQQPHGRPRRRGPRHPPQAPAPA